MKTKENRNPSSRLWRSPAEPAIELARIEYDDFCFEPHFHDHYVIMLVEEGINLGRRGMDAYEVMPGEMLVIRPGETHTGRSFANETLRYIAFYPDSASLDRWLEGIEHGAAAPEFKLKYRDPRLSGSFRRLFGAVSSHAGESMESEVALMEFLEALLATPSVTSGPRLKAGGDSHQLKRAQTYIRDHFAGTFSLGDVATAAGVSPYYLVRLFRRQCGLTPFDYVRSVRVERAKALMRSNASLTDIAHGAGFYDQSHFIRCFKKHTGFLPSEFRRRDDLSR